MRKLLLFIVLCQSILFCSCHRDRDALAVMDRAEALMDSLPDSALAMMRAIDLRNLRGAEAKAMYALTMSRALDRNNILVASDSIIAPAVGYYRSGRDPLRHTMTQYYLGRTLYHSGDYGNSIFAYLEGLETAKSDSLFFWAAMNARGVMQNFNRTYNGGQELEYAKISYDYFSKTSKITHTLYALLDMGSSYLNNSRYEESIPIFEHVAKESIECGDSILWTETMNDLVNSAYYFGDYTKAVVAARQLIDANKATTEDSVYMAASYARLQHMDSALILSRQLDHRKTDLSNALRFLIYYNSNDSNNEALNALIDVCRENTQLFYDRYHNDLTINVVDYYNTQQAVKETHLKSSRQIALFLGLISCLLIVIIVLLYIYLHVKLIRQRENYSILVDELHQSYDETSANRQMAREAFNSMIRTHYGLVDELCRGYIEDTVTKTNYNQIGKTITSIVKSFTESDKGFNEAEAIAVKYYGETIRTIRTDIPNLSDKDYRMVIYCSIGLSTTAIAMFLENGKISNIYNRKRHLKDKIKELDSHKAEEYLKILG